MARPVDADRRCGTLDAPRDDGPDPAALRERVDRVLELTAITTVYVTHDQVEAMSISDLIMVMNAGVVDRAWVTPRARGSGGALTRYACIIGRL